MSGVPGIDAFIKTYGKRLASEIDASLHSTLYVMTLYDVDGGEINPLDAAATMLAERTLKKTVNGYELRMRRFRFSSQHDAQQATEAIKFTDPDAYVYSAHELCEHAKAMQAVVVE